MAEAFLKEHGGDQLEAYSMGCAVSDETNHYTVRMRHKVGIDISDQCSKAMQEYVDGLHFYYVVTVCDRAEWKTHRSSLA